MFFLVYPPEPAPLIGKKIDPREEIFPLVEPNGLVIGRAPRSLCHAGSMLLHPVVNMHIIDRNARLYLQKRSKHKRTYPGCWDTSVGGHVGDARNYTYLYDKDLYCPLWSAYPLYSSVMNGSYPRPSWMFNPNFSQNYQITVAGNSYPTAYNAAAYSRGHHVPNADRNNNEEMQRQTFYVTNQSPQLQNKFNGSIWSALENAVRNVAAATDTVYVVTGATFQKQGSSEPITYLTAASSSYSPSSLPIPNYFWKVLLKVKRSGGTITGASAVGVWFEHREYESGDNFTNYTVSVDQIETWTGFNFFVNLPSALESSAETNSSWNTFSSF